MFNLGIKVENGYEGVVKNLFVQHSFSLKDISKHEVFQAVFDILVGAKKARIGPRPNAFHSGALIAVITSSIENGDPIQLLVPWGSKKPVPGTELDLAEVFAIQGLIELNEQVKAVYPPGVHFTFRVEDYSGYIAFKRLVQVETDTTLYTASLRKLIQLMEAPITTNLESEAAESILYSFDNIFEVVKPIMKSVLDGITPIDRLYEHGWKGNIPTEQREYYINAYRRLYPDADADEYNDLLADYLTMALARARSGLTLAPKTNHIKLSFVQPIPGADWVTALYRRTVADTMCRTHIPAWRAYASIHINKGDTELKLRNCREEGQEAELTLTGKEQQLVLHTVVVDE